MFTDTYRPTKVSDVILTSDVQQLITNIKNEKTIPNMIFYGGAELGKTTLARALCHDMQCEPFELNASLDNSIETVRRKGHENWFSNSSDTTLLNLPIGEHLSVADVTHVVNSIKEFFE